MTEQRDTPKRVERQRVNLLDAKIETYTEDTPERDDIETVRRELPGLWGPSHAALDRIQAEHEELRRERDGWKRTAEVNIAMVAEHREALDEARAALAEARDVLRRVRSGRVAASLAIDAYDPSLTGSPEPQEVPQRDRVDKDPDPPWYDEMGG